MFTFSDKKNGLTENRHCLNCRNFTQLPSVEMLWEGTVSTIGDLAKLHAFYAVS